MRLLTHWALENVADKLTNIRNSSFSTRDEKTRRWMPQKLTNQKSALVQAMAWCRQATSHYLIQCWPRYLCRHMTLLGHKWVKAVIRQQLKNDIESISSCSGHKQINIEPISKNILELIYTYKKECNTQPEHQSYQAHNSMKCWRLSLRNTHILKTHKPGLSNFYIYHTTCIFVTKHRLQ